MGKRDQTWITFACISFVCSHSVGKSRAPELYVLSVCIQTPNKFGTDKKNVEMCYSVQSQSEESLFSCPCFGTCIDHRAKILKNVIEVFSNSN